MEQAFILSVRDENGNVIGIPAIRGTAGKTAYQYAVEGGYTGTEEEFAAKMAMEVYSKDEVDAALGAYIADVASLVGGEV